MLEDIEYTPVSTWLKQYIPEFERESISTAIANRDGRKQDEVLAQWDMKGEYSRNWGNAVHGAIEYWVKYGEMPSNPILESVILSLGDVLGKDNKLISERMVWSNKELVAGTIDLIEVVGDKEVKIHDIKTTGDLYKMHGKLLDKFGELGNSPIEKFRLQLSKYKQLFEEMNPKVKVVGISVLHLTNAFNLIELEALDTKE